MKFVCLFALVVLAGMAVATAQPVDFTDLETARRITSGPASPRTSAGVVLEHSSSGASVPAGQGLRFSTTDLQDRVAVQGPGKLMLVLTRSEATFKADGVLPVTAGASVDAHASGQASARLHLDSQQIVDDVMDKLGPLPGGATVPSLPNASLDATANVNASAAAHGEASIDNIQGSAEATKRTQGILVGVPVAGGFHFFAGAKQVQEYLVVAVQGFDYKYAYNANAQIAGSETLTGQSGSASWGTSGQGAGHVSTPWARAGRSWEYTVAVVGVGYRGEKGGFHAVVDLDFAGTEIDPDGYIDLGPLKQLQMPGPVRDLDVGGDFRTGGFSAGANLKLFTFVGMAAGANVDAFVSQEFTSVSVGLTYHAQARGLMADQSAAIEVGFMPRDDTRVTLIGGVRVLSSYMPGFKTSVGKEFGRDVSGSFGGSTSNIDYQGSYSAGVAGRANVDVNQPATWRHEVQYAPGLRVELLSRGLSIEGGPVFDSSGRAIGGRGGVSYEVIRDRMELNAGGSRVNGQNAAALTLGVTF